MPLSEHEQRILAELEESLVQQDPEFAERVRSETVYRHAGRHCKWSALTFVVGVAVLVAFYSQSVVVGFLGVVIMFGSLVVFERNLRRMGKAGWYDLNKARREAANGGASRPGEGSSAPAGNGIDGAVHDAREWFRARFRRDS